MTKKNWTKTGLKVAGFGTAMAAAGSAQYAEAAIVNLDFFSSNVAFPQSGYGTLVKAKNGAATVFSFRVVNNSTYGKVFFNGSITNAKGLSFAVTAASVLKTFSNGDPIAGPFGGVGARSSNFGASAYIGFQSKVNSYLGWIKVAFGGTGGAIQLKDGAYSDDNLVLIQAGDGATTGGSTGGGGGEVPEPSSLAAFAGLGALALGAAGIKRKRAKAAA